MGRFKRVDKMVAQREAIEAAGKRIRRRLIVSLKDRFRLYGRVAQQTDHYLMHCARIIYDRGDAENVDTLYAEWLKQEPRSARSAPNDKPKNFFYWLRDRQLKDDDEVVYIAYDEYCKEYGIKSPDASAFASAGEGLMIRLQQWLGDSAGNDIEEVLVHYLKAVFLAASKWKITVMQTPTAALGDWGWGVFQEWVRNTYGGHAGYVLPTQREKKDAFRRVAFLNRLQRITTVIIQRDPDRYEDIMVGAAQHMDDLDALEQYCEQVEKQYAEDMD